VISRVTAKPNSRQSFKISKEPELVEIMLSQIVRPLVRTQIRLLANTQATRLTLISTIAQWLGYLGVQAQVSQLNAYSDQIHVTLSVGKPDACDPSDWRQILCNLQEGAQNSIRVELQYTEMTVQQQSGLQRLLAYLIQVGAEDDSINWEVLYPQLQTLELGEDLLLGIKSALKVPQSLEQILEKISPDVAAIALPTAVRIALLDRHVTPHEDSALSALLKAIA
jgi:hypothetical protein